MPRAKRRCSSQGSLVVKTSSRKTKTKTETLSSKTETKTETMSSKTETKTKTAISRTYYTSLYICISASRRPVLRC